MAIDIEVLNEVYLTLKEYIPSKDRQEASDSLTSVLIDLLSDGDMKIFGSLDSFTKKSIKHYQDDDYSDDEDDDEDDGEEY